MRQIQRLLFLVLIFFCLLLSSCVTHKPLEPGHVPRPSAPSAEDEKYGHEVLSKLSEQYELTVDHPSYNDLVDVINQLAKSIGAGVHPWHVYLFKDDAVKNAAATRGNHLFFWTGMLNFTRNKEEIATIASHEMSHIIAGHVRNSEKEVSAKSWINLGAQLAATIAARAIENVNLGDFVGKITAQATQAVGEGIFLNSYSKSMEMEADLIGMFLMADAGFDPKYAIAFWERASRDSDFSSTIPFFSTHPEAKERLERLKKYLLEAEKRYRNSISNFGQKGAF